MVLGHPAQEIVRAATDSGTDLIVLGHSGHSAIWGSLLGPTTERGPTPSCNPYLAFSAMLMAGLDGIRNKIEPPAPIDDA